VGSHGYVTFDAGDTWYIESSGHHFNQPRISGLFYDIDPSSGGTVSWKQLPDRVAVTYQDIPESFMNPPVLNSFQIEMFFNGVIRITHLQIETARGLVGLSAGNGMSPCFVESDLSEYPDCYRAFPRMIAWDTGAEELLAADFGVQGLWAANAAGVWGQLHADGDVHQMLVWNNNLVVDFGGGRGMKYHDGVGWHNMTAADTANQMIAWHNGITERLVVDLGAGRGMWIYDGAWNWLTGWDDANALAVWNQLLVVDFSAGRGLWNYDGTWHWMTNQDTAITMLAWDDGLNEVLVVDLGGTRAMWTYNGAWSWLTNQANAHRMRVWDNKLAVDFGGGRAMWTYNGAWNWLTNRDTANNMLAWDNGVNDVLVVDLGGGRAMWTYNGATWDWLSNNDDTAEMCQWIDRLAVDFGTGKGIYYRTGAWHWLHDWSTAD
jgi:hypothetical protein